MRLCRLLLLVLLGGACHGVPPPAPPAPPAPPRADAGRTHWVIEPHEAFDALCLLNLLRGDPFYVRVAPEPYARWSPRLAPAEREALRHVTHVMVEREHDVPSAAWTLAFSTTGARTTEQLLSVVDDDAAWNRMRRAVLSRPGTVATDFDELDAVRGDLRTLLRFLLREHFPERWRHEDLPAVETAIVRMRPALEKADVVAWDEAVLGRSLDVDALHVNVLAFVRPHGIRVDGWRFLSDASVGDALTVKTALHELLHPPYVRAGALAERLNALEQDPFFLRLVSEHDRSFGYNDARGLSEEDAAEAVDVFVSERHRLLVRGHGSTPTTGPEFFRDHDDGMHVFAFLLYRELGRADFTHWIGYAAFVQRFLEATPSLQARFEADPEHYPVRALQAR